MIRGLGRVILTAATVSAAFALNALAGTAAPFGARQNLSRPRAAERASVSPDSACKTLPCIYVTNQDNGSIPPSITVYHLHASGNVAPIRTISGSNTGLSAASYGIALDSSGNIYVASHGCGSNDECWPMNVYAAGAQGNAAPIRTIFGSMTGLLGSTGVALDASNNLYVANCCQEGGL